MDTSSSGGEGEGREWKDENADSPASGLPCKDGSLDDHISCQRSMEAVLDDNNSSEPDDGGNGISSAGSSNPQGQASAASVAVDTIAASRDVGLADGQRRAAAGDGDARDGDERDETMPLRTKPEEHVRKLDHASRQSVAGGEAGASPDDREVSGAAAQHAEKKQVVQDKSRGTGNSSRHGARTSFDDEEESTDAMSFVKDDDVSESEDEFGKGVAKHIGDHQQQQQQVRQPDQGEQGGGSAKGNQVATPSESLLHAIRD